MQEEFASKTDIWTGYRTAPHRDIAETFGRAAALLVRALRSGRRPQPALSRRVPHAFEQGRIDVHAQRQTERGQFFFDFVQ